MLEAHDAVANERLTLSNTFGFGEYSGCALPISDEPVIPPAWAQMAASAVPSEKLLGSVGGAGTGANDSSLSALSIARPGAGPAPAQSTPSPSPTGRGPGPALLSPAGSSDNQQGDGDRTQPSRSALMPADFEVMTIEPEPGGIQLTVLTVTRPSDAVPLVRCRCCLFPCFYFDCEILFRDFLLLL